jgi:hypothetical protein
MPASAFVNKATLNKIVGGIGGAAGSAARGASDTLMGQLRRVGGQTATRLGGTKLATLMSQGLSHRAGMTLGFGIGTLATGSLEGGAIGAAAGFAPTSRATRAGLQKLSSIAVNMAKLAGKNPAIAGGILSTSAVLTGMAAGTLNNAPLPTTGPVTSGRGYVSWTPGKSGGMSPNHLGATGGLALAMHNTRHRTNPKSLNLV